MSNILVTGANGQLGREIRHTAEGRHNYIYTDLAELDITDPGAVGAFVGDRAVDIIINCAAYTAVEKAEEDQDTADAINHKAVSYLARAAKQHGATLIHISTDYVFRGAGNLPCSEDEPADPVGVYGRTKLLGEEAILASGCKYLIFRTAWLYSAYGDNFVKTMLRLTGERESIQVVADQVGTPTYAADLAGLLVSLADNDMPAGREGIYHYSNEGVCSWYDFAHEVARLAGHDKCDVRPCRSWEFPSRVSRPVFSVLDKTKVKHTFGIDIPYWRDSLAVCIERLKNDDII